MQRPLHFTQLNPTISLSKKGGGLGLEGDEDRLHSPGGTGGTTTGHSMIPIGVVGGCPLRPTGIKTQVDFLLAQARLLGYTAYTDYFLYTKCSIMAHIKNFLAVWCHQGMCYIHSYNDTKFNKKNSVSLYLLNPTEG